MILASQAQKEAPKVSEAAAQTKINAAQMDSSAFSLLLAFMNSGASAPGGGVTDVAGDLGLASQPDETEQGSLADQAALAAKIADWLASNPASLAALGSLASGSLGAGLPVSAGLPEGLLDAIERSGSQSQQIQGLLANFGVRTPDASPVGTDQGVAMVDQGVALVSAIGQAGDSQSMASALMAAVAAGLGKSERSDKTAGSSNLLLANGLHGELSLADALSQALSEAASNGALAGLGVDHTRRQAGSGFATTESADQALAPNPLLDKRSDKPDGKDVEHGVSGALLDEQRQRQLEQTDALLSSALPGSGLSFDGLQQAMSAQNLGRVSIANASALEGTVSWLASQQGGSATIDLSPPELGSLRLELKIDAGGESAVLIVHAANDAAKAAIEQSLDRLYESFQSSGMTLQVSVGSGSSQFAGMSSNGFDERSKPAQEINRVAEGGRAGSISSPARANGVATDVLSLYA